MGFSCLMKLKALLLLALAAALSPGILYAQGPGGPPPALKLLKALDTDGDGIISAGEIANATASLKALDTNGDGELSPDEYGFGQPSTSGTSGGTSHVRRHNGPPPPMGMDMEPGQRPPPGHHEIFGLVRALTGTDGVISAASIANAPALLKRLDKNGDGQLSPAEYGPEKSPLLWALDTDGDGVISATEIANAATSLKLLDKNGDGELTSDEYEGPKPPGPPSSGRGSSKSSQPENPPENPLVSALDADGDGTISAGEIIAAPTALKTLDKNGDGQLGPGEYHPAPPRD